MERASCKASGGESAVAAAGGQDRRGDEIVSGCVVVDGVGADGVVRPVQVQPIRGSEFQQAPDEWLP
jgi:hypothetical protein